jgi:Leucine-rich repeat (LRR) protein
MKKLLSRSKLVSLLMVMLILLVCKFNLNAQQNQIETSRNENGTLVENQLKKIDDIIKKDLLTQIDKSISEMRQSKTGKSLLKSGMGLAAISENDSTVLVTFYNETDGPNWTVNTNWLTGPISTWYGITVEGDNITEIRLKENNLTGTIPAELGQLASLQYLSLDTNNLTGNIPVELGNLTNLDYLYLSGNQLSGTIPSELGNLNNLLLLYLAGNQLSGSIPVSLSNLASLRWFDLEDNELTGNIPVELGQLSSVEYLDLSNNRLSGSLPVEFSGLNTLRWMVISNNQLSGAIPNELSGMANLEMLYLNGNQLTGNLPVELNNISNLRWLNLSQNQLTGSLPAGYSNLSELELFYLNENLFTGSVPSELGSVPSLRWLNLGLNQFSGAVPAEIWQPNLSLLYLDNNQLTGTIPSALGSMTNIEWLNLNSNLFTGSVPSEISQLNRLKILQLDSNHLDEMPDIVVSDSLTDLTVFGNKFTFDDLEQNMDILSAVNFVYAPQDSISVSETITKNEGETFSYTLTTGGTQNDYQWFKDGEILPLQTSSTIDINNLTAADAGIYYCEVTNTLVPGLTLTSREITLKISVCIKLKFVVGWNILSSPVMPADANMEAIFQPFIDNESLIKIQDENGNTLEDRGIFGGWTNTIGEMLPAEGYSIKMSKEDSIQICGSMVEYPFAIPLKKGWNIINYPHLEAYNGQVVVQQLIDRDVLIKVQDEAGKSIEDYGIFGDWTNNIGNFVAGEGYKIKVSEDDTLWMYSSYPKSNAILSELTPSVYYKPVFQGNGLNHMNINLVNLSESGIKTGDEIGIFDGYVCVGSAKVTGMNSSKISLTASAKDGGTELANGFINGNDITLKIYRDGKEFPLSLQTLNGTTAQFEKNGTLFAFANTELNTGITLPENVFDVNLFPNPFQDMITIKINLSKQENLDVEIYDLNSRRIQQLYSGIASGQLILQWDGNDSSGNKVANGIYICRINKMWKKVVLNGN